MDLTYTTEDLAFGAELRTFLSAELPARLRDVAPSDESAQAAAIREWQGILHARGWGAVSWPRAFGGRGESPVRQYIFELECALTGAPGQLPFGLKMLAPVLMKYGSSAQQQRFLPRILSGQDWWCQGYSEPGAGSDLASLKTQAIRAGANYIVNGQKCWNTLGQHADWIFCLVRTDATVKAQRGISLLLIDMRSPGITVRPTRLLDGTCEVNEIFLQDVSVPAENRVGDENAGWTYAKYLLGHERANIAGVGGSRRALLRLKSIAAAEREHGQSLLHDPAFRRRIARVEIDLLALEMTNLRVASATDATRSSAIEASILKIRGSEIRQTISELMMEAIGSRALAMSRPASAGSDSLPLPGASHTAGLTASYLNLRKLSIFGGSNEIQKNIISQVTIGL
jgi:alkylation response protein AidB-like acyl-CoA dehydrogenase